MTRLIIRYSLNRQNGNANTMNRRFYTSRDYGVLFTPEQAPAVRSPQPADLFDRVQRGAEHKPTTITHTDRDGKQWRFVLTCTDAQAENLKRLLAGFGSIGVPKVLTFSGCLNAEDVREFYRGLERLFLSALSLRYPRPVEVKPKAGNESKPAPSDDSTETTETNVFWWQRD